MVKRGQITLFVMLGIVIIAVIATAFYMSQQFSKAKSLSELSEAAGLSKDELDAKNIVESCLEDSLGNGVLEVFRKGGALSNGVKRVSGLNAPVYGQELPSLGMVETEIGKYVDSSMEACIRKNMPSLIIRNPGETIVTAKGNNVEAISSIEIVVSEASILKDFSAGVEADIEKVLNDANELYREEKETGRFVALGNISRNSRAKEYLLFTESTDKEKIYLMAFKNIKIDNKQLEFLFAFPIEERTMVAGINITELDLETTDEITSLDDILGVE